jgi:hypothetical protein
MTVRVRGPRPGYTATQRGDGTDARGVPFFAKCAADSSGSVVVQCSVHLQQYPHAV